MMKKNKTWLMIFVALLLVSGTIEENVDLGRKGGFGTPKNPDMGNEEEGKGDAGVDSHHTYISANRPGGAH